MASGPTYRLLPNFEHRPNAAIHLGTVLLESRSLKCANPSAPVKEVVLTPDPTTVTRESQDYRTMASDLPEIRSEAAVAAQQDPDNMDIDTCKEDTDQPRRWHFTDTIDRKDAGGVYSDLPGLTALMAGLGWKRSSERGISVTCERIDTEFFEPDDAYKEALLLQVRTNPRCKQYSVLSSRPWLYLVKGIKVAYAATIDYTWGRDVEAEGNVGVDMSAMTVPVRFGPSASFARGQHGSQSEYRQGPFIIAYRLHRLRPKKNAGYSEKPDRKGGNFLYDDEQTADAEDVLSSDVRDWEFEDIAMS